MVTTLKIRLAVPSEAARIGEAVSLGFFDDPLTEWLVPEPEQRMTVLPAYFTPAVEVAIETGTVYVAGDYDAVAVWFDMTAPAPEHASGPAPAAEPDAEAVATFGRYAGNIAIMDQLMHEAEPHDPPHHQLAFLIVRKELQGRGLGSQLLDVHHAKLDDAQLPAYLNATHPDSRRLYLRRGYHDLAEPYYPPGGAPIWPMWRPAGGRPA